MEFFSIDMDEYSSEKILRTNYSKKSFSKRKSATVVELKEYKEVGRENSSRSCKRVWKEHGLTTMVCDRHKENGNGAEINSQLPNYLRQT